MNKTQELTIEALQQQNERLKETIENILLSNGHKTISFPDVVNSTSLEVIGFEVRVNGFHVFHVYTNTNIRNQIFGITCHDSKNTTIMNINRMDADYSKSSLLFRPIGQRKLSPKCWCKFQLIVSQVI